MERIIIESKNNTEFIIDKNIDLFLHILCHFDVDNVASIYNQQYIQRVCKIKGEDSSSLEKELKKITNEKLVYLSFMPAYWNSHKLLSLALEFLITKNKKLKDEFSQIQQYLLKYLESIFDTKEDLQNLSIFHHIVKNEYNDFYSKYWDSNIDNFNKRSNRFKQIWESKNNSSITNFFKNHNKTRTIIYLSECMLKYGRGIQINNTDLCAITKLPDNNNDDAFNSYFTSIHEMLHQILDSITTKILDIDNNQRSLNSEDEGFNIHMTYEISVMYFQLLIVQKTFPEHLNIFLKQLEIKSDNEFHTKYKIEKSVKDKLDSLFKKSFC